MRVQFLACGEKKKETIDLGETLFKLLLTLSILALVLFGINKIVEKSNADFNEAQYAVAEEGDRI